MCDVASHAWRTHVLRCLEKKMENDSYVKIAKDACSLIARIELKLAMIGLIAHNGKLAEAAGILDDLREDLLKEDVLKRYAALESGAGDRERAEAYASEVCDE